MADAALLTNFQDFLVEKMMDKQLTFAIEFPLLALLSGALKEGGYDPGYQRYNRGVAELAGDRETFHGKKVTFPLQLSDVSASGLAEGGTFPGAVPFDTAQATLNLARTTVPIAVSLDLARDAQNASTSALEAVGGYIDSAYRAAARVENDMLHGNGDALLVNVNSATGSGTLVVDVGTSNVPWDQLTPGRVCSILTRANGADPGNGKRRKIASVSRTAGTVTFKTAAVASDGGSGNITFSSAEGIYIDASFGAAAQGLQQATATTGTFEGIDKSLVAQWKGIDASPSSTAALADEILDNATYLLRGNGVNASDFGIAHPKVIDLYKQSKATLVIYTEVQETTLPTGFKGITYQGADNPYPLIKDLSAPRGKCRLIYREALQIFGDEPGPSFIDDDGFMWRFYGRAAVKEANLYDRWQLGVKDCGKLANIGSLLEATP